MTSEEKARIRRARWKAKVGNEYLRKYYRNYYKTHPSVKIHNDEWKERNPDKVKAYTDSRKNHKVQYDRKRYTGDVAERKKFTSLQWAKRNPHRMRDYGGRRRALEKSASVNLRSIKEYFAAVRSKRFAKCYYCEKRIRSKGCHFDHIIPLSKGGPHSVENLCVTCPSCNCSKQDKLVGAWFKIGQQMLNL